MENDLVYEELTITVEDINQKTRIDKWLSGKLNNFTRSSLSKLFEKKLIQVNSNVAIKSYYVTNKDIIKIKLPPIKELDIIPQNIPLHIVYEDDDLLVLNKEKGMVVHPSNGHTSNTLVNALLYHCKGKLSGINGIIRPGIVHRIDKFTSGLLIVAKNNTVHIELSNQMKEHCLYKEYNAIVYGKFKQDAGEIILPIGRCETDRKKMAVTEKNSKIAITLFEVINTFEQFSHLKLILKTGRTHQIRVHMAHVNHPIAGDNIYGPKKVIEKLNGQCLHAKKLGFIHPITNKYLELDTPLPSYFNNFLKALNSKSEKVYE